jgi:hypothetical protein
MTDTPTAEAGTAAPAPALHGEAAWAFEYFRATGQALSSAESGYVPEIAASVLAITARLKNLVSPELPFTPVYSALERSA